MHNVFSVTVHVTFIYCAYSRYDLGPLFLIIASSSRRDAISSRNVMKKIIEPKKTCKHREGAQKTSFKHKPNDTCTTVDGAKTSMDALMAKRKSAAYRLM